MTLRQFILVLSSASVELSSILVPSYSLRVTALLTSGCSATVESLFIVLYSCRAMPIARAVSAKFKAFSFPLIKQLVRCSVLPCFPASPVLGVSNRWSGIYGGIAEAVCMSMSSVATTHYIYNIHFVNMQACCLLKNIVSKIPYTII